MLFVKRSGTNGILPVILNANIHPFHYTLPDYILLYNTWIIQPFPQGHEMNCTGFSEPGALFHRFVILTENVERIARQLFRCAKKRSYFPASCLRIVDVPTNLNQMRDYVLLLDNKIYFLMALVFPEIQFNLIVQR